MRTRALTRSLIPDRLLEPYFLRRQIPAQHRIAYSHGLISPLPLFFLEQIARWTVDEEVPGDFVECGVYKGGSAGVLGIEMMRDTGAQRRLRLYDSFQGMPAAGPEDGGGSQTLHGSWVGSVRSTRRNLRRVGVPPARFEIVPGWFDRTLPRARGRPIALLHVDCDFYAPVRLSLETLYADVSPGGYVVVDDYGCFEGARRATEEFIARELPGTDLEYAGGDAVFFRRPPARDGASAGG